MIHPTRTCLKVRYVVPLCQSLWELYELIYCHLSETKEKVEVDIKFTLPGKERQDSVFSGLQVQG